MGYVKYGAYIGWALLLLCPLALSRLDDDFAFDNSEEFQVNNIFHNIPCSYSSCSSPILFQCLLKHKIIQTKHAICISMNGIFLQVELQPNHSEIEKNGLRRLWGVPDTSAYVGHLFRMEIPKEAFSGPVNTYKVHFRFLFDLLYGTICYFKEYFI